MVKQTIQIFARLKPTKASKAGLYDLEEDSEGCPQLTFTVPRDIADGLVNNKKEAYKFRFEKVFDQRAKQDEIFENVAQPVINNVLQGYNGTIFAYGQTGSGKTFTITGGAERYVDRGIIPRTLSYIYQYYAENPEFVYTTHVSYLEIYNESGYDLLDPKHEAAKLEDLPKVALMEDSEQNIHLKNLSTHPANNEEEALNLLFLGDTNRMIAETPMNQASTRSHCIFTIHVTSRESSSATVRRAKLHLVDLAGSERVSKTGVNGVLLTEAKYINLSLHYLEQVIVSLSERNRQHIPYRNSMMTSVLRDSLGGNCMTTMIATCSVEKKNIDESISTCRFAQRVALIKNDAILNEELDPKLVIARLKNQVNQLKEELSIATGEQRTDELTQEEIERCKEAVKFFLEDDEPEATVSIGGDMRKIQHCFRLLKQEVQRRASAPDHQGEPPPTDHSSRTPVVEAYPPSSTEASRLRELIKQRDNEINILVNMLKKEKKRAADAVNQLERAGQLPNRSASQNDATNGRHAHSHTLTRPAARVDTRQVSSADQMENAHQRPPGGDWRNKKPKTLDPAEEKAKKQILGDLSLGRQEAFETYRRDYEDSQTISDNKATLKQRYAEAKTLGTTVNHARTKINKLKASIEQHRMSRVMQGLVDPDQPEPDEMEQDMKLQIEDEKATYKEAFNRLRVLKTEIEHLQHFLERSKVKLMKDFELWWAEQAAAAQEQQNAVPRAGLRKAWKTPPVTPPAQGNSVSEVQKPPSVASRLLSQLPAALPGGQDGDERFSPQRARATFIKDSPALPNSSMPLTGDAQADADIMAFLKARHNVMKAAQQQPRR